MKKSIAIVFTIICSIYFSIAVQAHSYLDSSTPASESVMTTDVNEIRITFEKPIEKGSYMEIIHSNGLSLEPLEVQVSGKNMIATMKEPLENDEYTVLWSIISMDGHIVEDSFRFVVKNPTNQNGSSSSELTNIQEEKNVGLELKNEPSEANQESTYLSVFKEHKEGFVLLTVLGFALLLISNRKSQ